MSKDETIQRLSKALPDLRARYGVTRIGLFGSVARNEARADSDVDLAAEFDPDAKIGIFELFALERELSALLRRRATVSALSQMNRIVRASAERDLVYAE